jgi:threonine aldolase
MTMNAPSDFRSDNVTGVSPQIMAALAAANVGTAASYGGDEATARLQSQFSEIFEKDVAVFPVLTGTAANVLSLTSLTPPHGSVFCHRQSHIEEDEAGGTEFYTGGAKLVLLDGPAGKYSAQALSERLATAGKRTPHMVPPTTVSITQATELGGVYTLDEISAITEVARRRDMGVHMDGARFANALVRLGCSPADMTWRAGVDVLSFGSTKNGAMGAEAVVFFDLEKIGSFIYNRMRGGHLASKMRFLSAQLEAYLTDGLWLDNAAHANAAAQRLSAGLMALPGAKLLAPVEANEIFLGLPEAVIAGLESDGHLFHRWSQDGGTVYVRLVCAWNSPADMIDALIAAADRRAAQAAAE